jgi:large subunit ribosomal protein L17
MHRHAYNGRKFSREAGPRKALFKNLASQVILYEKVTTTLEKAKEIRPVVEKLITKAKKGTLADRRNAGKVLSNNDKALEKLFAELGPLYKDRNGGYTRIIKLDNRVGDNAKMAQISLLDTEKLTKKELEKKPKKAVAKEAPKAEATKAPAKKPVAKPAAKKTTAKETKVAPRNTRGAGAEKK